jgi:O-antigen/teichoic acid export membrane protein
MNRQWQWLPGVKYRYVAVSMLVSLIAFTRNLLLMKTLDLTALGQMALMQTLVMLVGFLQVGLMNGAYIQYAARDREINRLIIQVITTGILLLVPVVALVAQAAKTFGLLTDLIWPGTLTIGLAAGIATLASTWMNNSLIADGMLAYSNLINLGAVLVSLLVAILSQHQGLTAALFAVLVQPLAVAIGALVIAPNLRPRRLGLHFETIALLFKLGFTPFISGLAVLATHQVERWSIAVALGPEELGRFYLVLMYATFFALVPSALLNVYFPPAKRAFATQEAVQLRNFVHRHLRDLLVYFLLAVLLTVLLMPTLVARFLPTFSSSTALVYYALPGLLLFTLRDSASLILFSSGQMRQLLTAGAMTFGLFCFALLLLAMTGTLSLITVIVARAVTTLPGTLLLFVVQWPQLNEVGRR